MFLLPLKMLVSCYIVGNIFVLQDGRIGLIDFGQVKQISGRNRETLCKVMIALHEREGDDRQEDLDRIGSLALELGVELNDDAQPEAAAAIGMWLFDGTIKQLPGMLQTLYQRWPCRTVN
jgi:aarF domain-containing kinase